MPKFKIGDKVIYVGYTTELWKLERLKEYTIDNRAFDTNDQMFYAVSNCKGVHSSWYKEEDFISVVESRKYKLEEIEKRRRG